MPGIADISAVHGKICNDFRQRVAQTVQCEVAGGSFGEGNPRELIGEHIQFTDQRNSNNQFSAAVGDVVKGCFSAGKISVKAFKARERPRSLQI